MGKGLLSMAATQKIVKANNAKQASARLAKDASDSRAARLSLQRDKMLKLLDARPDVWPDVIFMLESGYFNEEEETDDNILHKSCNKWHLLSSDKLYKLCELFISTDICDRLTKPELLKLLCFLLNVDSNSALHSKRFDNLLNLV